MTDPVQPLRPSQPYRPYVRSLTVGLVAASVTVLAATYLRSGTPEAIRISVGVPLLLLAPGYATAKALFPGRAVAGAEVIGLSVALSIGEVVLVTLLLNLLPWHLSARSWSIGVGCVITLAATTAAFRAPVWRPHRTGVHAFHLGSFALIGVALALLAGSVALAFRPLPPPRAVQGYTQLWLVRARDHLQVGVQSFEFGTRRFQLRLLAGGHPVGEYTLDLRPGRTWSLPVSDRGEGAEAQLWVPRPAGGRILYRDVRLPSSSSGS